MSLLVLQGELVIGARAYARTCRDQKYGLCPAGRTWRIAKKLSRNKINLMSRTKGTVADVKQATIKFTDGCGALPQNGVKQFLEIIRHQACKSFAKRTSQKLALV